MLSSLQPVVTPSPGALKDSSGFCRHCSYAHNPYSDAHVHMIKNKMGNILFKLKESGLWDPGNINANCSRSSSNRLQAVINQEHPGRGKQSSVTLRSAWLTQWILEQPELHSTTLSWKTDSTKQKEGQTKVYHFPFRHLSARECCPVLGRVFTPCSIHPGNIHMDLPRGVFLVESTFCQTENLNHNNIIHKIWAKSLTMSWTVMIHFTP